MGRGLGDCGVDPSNVTVKPASVIRSTAPMMIMAMPTPYGAARSFAMSSTLGNLTASLPLPDWGAAAFLAAQISEAVLRNTHTIPLIIRSQPAASTRPPTEPPNTLRYYFTIPTPHVNRDG